MSKKKKAFIHTRRGRGIVTVVAVGIAATFILSLIPGSVSDNEPAEDEWKEVLNGLQIMRDSAVPPIEDLQTDERILGFASSQADATDNMADEGLIDITDAYIQSGSIVPLNVILGLDSTRYKYWIEPDGSLYQLLE